MLEVRLLGQFEIRHDGQPVRIPLRPAQSLLAYLLLNPDLPHRREKLAGLFWPELPEASARSNLRHALWLVRKALGTSPITGHDYLLADEFTVVFDPEADVWLDTRVLEQRLEAPAALDALTAAVDVYRGELLPGFYDEWIGAERERLQAVFETKMGLLLEQLLAAGRWGDVLAWGERWIACGRTPEAAYRALITAHSQRGDAAQAADVFQRCVAALQRELGVEPSPATRSAYERVQRGADRPGTQAQPRPAGPPHNLPAPVSRFVGRERELGDIQRLFTDPVCRLVTLVGPGGSGKTRLAVEAARRLLPDFADGVWLASLAPVDRAEGVPTAVCAALGIQPMPGLPAADQLAAVLQARQMLLVIDNCEHVLVGVAPLVTQLLAHCPALTVVATAREVLRVDGEHVYPLAGLGVPAAGGGREQVLQAEAGRLLADRAGAARPGFAVTAANADYLTRICRDLDGLPLALELAAARLTSLSPKEVAERLGERFQWLGGRRGAATRHSSLEAAIDWSYQLLSEAERLVFRRLSVFQGGWTLEAAEQVCAGEGVEAGTVAAMLGSLVDKSLVLAETTAEGGTRYRLLETLREYGQRQLAESGEVELTCQRHADCYLRLAEEAQLAMYTPDEPVWAVRLAPDEDNLFAAIQRSLDRDLGAAALRIGSALSQYLADTARRRSEYVELMARALDMHPAVTPLQRGRVLRQVAFSYHIGGNSKRAQAATEEALQLARASGDQACIGSALVAQGLCLDGGQASRACYAAAVQLARDTGDIETAIAFRLLARFEPPEAARALLLEYQAIALRKGSLGDLAIAAEGLGGLAYSLGDLAEAAQQFQTGCEFLERVNRRWNRADALEDLALMFWSIGDFAHAASLLGESLEQLRLSGWLPGLAQVFRCKGILAWWQGHLDEAEACFQESVSHASRWNRQLYLALTGYWWAKLARDTGELAQAWVRGEQALKALKAIDRPSWIYVGGANCQAALASVAHRQGDLVRALALYQEALRSMPHDHNLLDLRDGLEGQALALAATGEHQMAARLLGFTAGRLAAFGIVRPVPEQRFYDQELARLRAGMAEAVFAQAWEAGQLLTFEQAVAEALGERLPQAG
jgi:predicted ATPase/DNA-binding SARP family transcriptional activator